MTRYTKKYAFSFKTDDGEIVSQEVSYIPLKKRDKGALLGEDAVANEAIAKLSSLEDIEEELGVDLITLFKAFKNGIWSKGGYYDDCCLDSEPHFMSPEQIELGAMWYTEREHKNDADFSLEESNALCLYARHYDVKVYCVRVKDYGRTWALAKEELE